MGSRTLFSWCFLLSFLLCSGNALDTISASQTIKDGETIISSKEEFELGFFNISARRYLGIRYRKMARGTIVWVANRNTPLNDTSSVLKFTSQGILVLLNSSDSIVWSSNTSTTLANPVAQLLQTGNLVVRERDDTTEGNYLWQSFDHMGNTFMPSMKFGRNLATGLDNYMLSWKGDDDPSHGHYTNRLDPSGYPQIFLRKDDSITYNSGPWNGERYSGMPNLKPNALYTFEFVMNKEEIYYRYDLINNSVPSRMILSSDGILQRYTWNERIGNWFLYLTAQMDTCDRYALCGAFGKCNINNSPACGCLKGFAPKNPSAWEIADWSDGCERTKELDCPSDGFRTFSSVKLPDTRKAWYNGSMSLKECKEMCRKNCSCNAYANSNITNGGSGCLLWFTELVDIREYSDDSGQDLYVRLAASALDDGTPKRRLVLVILAPLLTLGTLILVLSLSLRMRKKQKFRRERTVQELSEESSTHETEETDLELPLFDFETLAKATNNFSPHNMLGQGGFGLVYKGKVKDGLEIAVKRLSKSSRQGNSEFKNEVSCIAKLQHRNLVKLLGCCIKGEERMLIYEYMTNKSLDSFIFDRNRKSLLDWPKRFNIINGIARGLLYLHQDSRMRVIHRDLKVSNILLDYELNPKISDFGMARMFGGNETQGNTTRVVGTYGYMSPEYAVDGLFSIKSDVFSFGVLVLEIVSGKKNKGFHHPDHDLNLLGHAWRLYNEGKSLELLDVSVKETCILLPEVVRSIHIGLLCVQQNPDDRPNMSMVILMLGSSIALPDPKQPGFFTERRFGELVSSSSMPDASANGMSVTFLDPR